MIKSNKRQKTHCYSVRMTPLMYDKIHKMASQVDISPCEVIRQCVEKTLNVKDELKRIPESVK